MFDSGITTLNLAVTGMPNKFSSPGNTIRLCGESDAGKTALALTITAASFYACKGVLDPVFYPFEPNLLIDIERLYGKKFAKALTVVNVSGMSAEMWQADIRGRFKAARRPMIATTDSTDAMKCNAEMNALDGNGKKKETKHELPDLDEKDLDPTASALLKELRKNGVKAGMGTSKPLVFSLTMSEVCKAASQNGGLNILISHVREKTGVLFGSNLYTAGGRAIGYGSETTIWLYKSTKERAEDVTVGGWTKIEVKRNKVNGEVRTIYAPIYPAYGIDDIRAMLHFLADTESGAEWASSDMKRIRVGDMEKPMAEMAAFYDTDATRDTLKRMVTEAWQAREAKIAAEVLAGRRGKFA